MERACFQILQSPLGEVEALKDFTMVCVFAIMDNTSYDLKKTQMALRVSHKDNNSCEDEEEPRLFQFGYDDLKASTDYWHYPTTQGKYSATFELPDLRFSEACSGHTWRVAFTIRAWNIRRKDWSVRTWFIPTDFRVVEEGLETALKLKSIMCDAHAKKVAELKKTIKRLECATDKLETFLKSNSTHAG